MRVILGVKKGMTTVYRDRKAIPVTAIDVSDCVISRIESEHIELGLRRGKGNRAMQGNYKELGYIPRFRKMFLKKDIDGKIGEEIKANVFTVGSKVKIVSVSKGKGFAGVMKRWGFSGGSRTHGQSDRERAGGSIGAGTDPGRVLKGKKMPGRMGGNKTTLDSVEIVEVGDSWLLLKGGIPGGNGTCVIIKTVDV